jgi:penicillin-binding protein 2
MSDLPRLRLAVVGVVVLSLFFALFSRLWYLQVIDTVEFQRAAANNQVRILYSEAPRGRILDRNGNILVDNRVSVAITVAQRTTKDHPETIPKLAALLNVSEAELEERIADPKASPYKPVPVALDIPDEMVVFLREHSHDFPGVEVAQLALRNYPAGPVAAHLIGYVGEINDTELEQRKQDGYRLGDTIGKTGVEKIYEEDLRGKPGVVKLEVDSEGRVLRTLADEPPVRGNDIQLTLDLEVQRVTEESLVRGLERARERRDRENKEPFKAPAGSAVVLSPQDGSVIAMASYPTYDPAEFTGGISVERFRQLNDPANHAPLNNRAIYGQYAPGSTFKLITALAGVEKGLVNERTTIVDRGSYTISPCRGRCTFRNAGSTPYGRVNLQRSLTVSSDVYYYQLGHQFWERRSETGDAIQEMARRFGVASKTGVPLPGEAAGRILDPEGLKRLNEEAPKAFPDGRWYTGYNLNIAIGQGDTVMTPIQLANVYATFGNGGKLLQPKVVWRVISPEQRVVREESEKVVRTIDLPGRAAIEAGLAGAIRSDEGTAAGAFGGFPLNTFPIAGKTGTAQVTGKQDSAVFAAYGPVGNPQYAIAVIMEEAGFGGSTAAPVARRIFDLLAGLPVNDVQTTTAID